MQGRNFLLSSLAFLASDSLCSGQQTPNADLHKLQGNWLLVAREVDGVRRGAIGILRLRIKDRSVSRCDIFGSTMFSQEGQFRLDASRNPRQIDFSFLSPVQVPAQIAIYRFEGDDLVIC